jgi:hypothetical protein
VTSADPIWWTLDSALSNPTETEKLLMSALVLDSDLKNGALRPNFKREGEFRVLSGAQDIHIRSIPFLLSLALSLAEF